MQLLTERFERASAWAIELLADERTELRQAAHPFSVAALVLEDGGGEDEAIAGLLHHAVKNGRATLDEIRGRFGFEVAAIVEASSQMPADGEGAQDRLQRYAWSLDGRSETALRVVNAIALHNARDLLRDYRQMGDLVWDRFHPLPSGTVQLWYLGLLRGEFWKLRSRYPLAREFHDTVDELKREMDKRVRYQAIFVDSTARSVFRNVGLYYEGFNPIERRWLGSPVACDMFCGVDLSGNDVDELEALEIARALMTKIANAQ